MCTLTATKQHGFISTSITIAIMRGVYYSAARWELALGHPRPFGFCVRSSANIQPTNQTNRKFDLAHKCWEQDKWR